MDKLRKTMQKEITKTTVKLAKMDLQDGQPVAVPLPDETLLGNVSLENAQKQMSKKHQGATVFSVEPDTVVYEMSVEDFIKYATIKQVQAVTDLSDQA